jgi:uncharacterized protein YqeY
MTMIAAIKQLSLQARKERTAKKAALYSTLLGEAQMVGKNNGNRESTDGEVIAVIKKMVANTKEMLDLVANAQVMQLDEQTRIKIDDTANELEWLTALLPTQITGETLALAIDALITQNGFTSIKDMGKLMKVIKETYDGQYDGTEASKIVKEKLSVAR